MAGTGLPWANPFHSLTVGVEKDDLKTWSLCAALWLLGWVAPRGQQEFWEIDATGVRGEGDASRDRVSWPVVSGLLLVCDTEWWNEVPDYQESWGPGEAAPWMSLGCACHIMECQRRKHLVSVSVGVTEYNCCRMCSCVLVSMYMILFCPYMSLCLLLREHLFMYMMAVCVCINTCMKQL